MRHNLKNGSQHTELAASRTSTRARTINIGIKLAIMLLFLGGIAWQIGSRDHLSELWVNFKLQLTWGHLPILLVVFALMPVNWTLETLKWTVLLRPAIRLPFFQAFKGIMSGITFSLFTPNRIGEYGGRILHVPAKHNWHAVASTLVGSFSQNINSLTVGVVALLVVLPVITDSSADIMVGIAIFCLLVIVFCFFSYFRIDAIYDMLEKIFKKGFARKGIKALSHISNLDSSLLVIALRYSFVRYAVFCTQYVLMLLFFGVDVPIIWLYCGVAVIFLFHTTIPLPPFVDIIARGEIALLMWNHFEVNELSILAASFFIWIINLVLPAFFGLFAVGDVNVLKSLGYEKKAS